MLFSFWWVNSVRPLFFISLSIAINLILSVVTFSCKYVPVTDLTKRLIFFYLSKLVGNVQILFYPPFSSISFNKYLLYSWTSLFYFSTYTAHFILLKVYSWPLNILTLSLMFSVSNSMFLTIYSAFPSKNLPIPPENRVSPVKAHY